MKGETTATFVEGVVRRARKYFGCLVCGTQSVNDYYKNDAAMVIFENSANFVCLSQTPSALDMLSSGGKISVDDSTLRQLKSLNQEKGRFAEMGIYSDDTWTFGRLVLDQFSLGVFSSDGQTVTAIQDLMSQGHSRVEALDMLAKKGMIR